MSNHGLWLVGGRFHATGQKPSIEEQGTVERLRRRPRDARASGGGARTVTSTDGLARLSRGPIMEPSAQITDIAHAIQLAVTPIFLLAGVGITVNILTTRLGRIVDRARVLTGQAQARDMDEPPAVGAEMAVLSRRARLIYRAIALSITCAPCVCLTVTTLFVGALLVLNLSTVISLLFVTAMLSLIGALLTFFCEILLATHHLRIGPSSPQSCLPPSQRAGGGPPHDI